MRVLEYIVCSTHNWQTAFDSVGSRRYLQRDAALLHCSGQQNRPLLRKFQPNRQKAGLNQNVMNVYQTFKVLNAMWTVKTGMYHLCQDFNASVIRVSSDFKFNHITFIIC